MTSAPLLVSADPLLVAEVHRLAAAAGVTPAVVEHPAVALREWVSAPLVLVGVDAAARVAEVGPPRRSRVHLLGRGPVADPIYRDAVVLGAESVCELPDVDAWLVELLTDVGDGASSPGATIGVVGGSGGAGASVFAAALAQQASLAAETLLVDADPLGMGADRLLGLDDAEGIRWDALLDPSGRLSSRSLRGSLPRSGRLAVLGWPIERAPRLPAQAMREALSAGQRGFSVVVVDLPRQLDEVCEETLARCDHVVVVAQTTMAGATAAARLVQRLPDGGPRRHLVTRGRSSGVRASSMARLLGIAVLAEMRDQRGLDESVDLGLGPARRTRGPLARAACEAVGALVP